MSSGGPQTRTTPDRRCCPSTAQPAVAATPTRHSARAAGGGLLAAGVATVLAWWLTRVVGTLATRAGSTVPLSPDESLTLLAAVLGLAVATWLAVGVLLAVLAHLPGRVGASSRRMAEQVAPALSRRVAAVMVGAALGGALAPGTATAGETPVPGARDAAGAPSPAFSPHGALGSGRTAGPKDGPHSVVPHLAGTPAFAPSTSVDGGRGSAGGAPDATCPRAAAPAPSWVPQRPPVRPQPSTRLVTTPPPADQPAGVVVRRGDTLWSIARDHLGPDASDAEVAAHWPRWHAANRGVIGPDADALLPGQVLRPPGIGTRGGPAGADAPAPTRR